MNDDTHQADTPASQPALPDRLCAEQNSPYFDEAVFAHDIGIRFNGKEKTNVTEYCISENWIRVEAGKSKDRKGNQLTIKLKGAVEPFYK